MRRCVLAVTLLCSGLVAGIAPAQVPTLPEGARTHWVVGQPSEVVAYVTFDPATVERQVPRALRFITVKELAASGIRWATDYLAEHPTHDRWGVSFLEIVRMGTFTIDGRAPNWPEHGAAALWCARVAPSDPTSDPGPGRPFLVLEFWMPDRAYVAYMRAKGHYATYGDVTLVQHAEGRWRGTVSVAGFSVVAECTPTGAVTGGVGSDGMQTFFPPLSSTIESVVRTSAQVASSTGAIAAWLRQGERQAQAVACAPFDGIGLRRALHTLRALTEHPEPNQFLPQLVATCSAHGVALVIVPAPKGCPASGATRWLSPDKAVLQLSLRYKTNDHLWFTVFHEAGHLLLHGKRLLFLEGTDAISAEHEEEADRFARDALLPASEAARLPGLGRSSEAVCTFATRAGVAPGIVVGRMQKEGLLDWSHLNGLKVRYEWKE